MADASAVIVSYNTKDLTLQAIESVANDSPKLKKEIIVVDNGSSDGSVAAIRKFQSSNSKIQIRLIENRDNLGFAKANNQGIKAAKGNYIFLLNSDAEVKKNTIKKLISFAQKKKDAGVVVPKLLNPDKSEQASVFRLPTISLAIRQYWLNEKGLLDKYIPAGNNAQEVEAAVMAAFLITPRALKEVGPLDERYFMYFEDLDYCRKIKKAGFKIYYLPNALAIHHHGASGKKLAKKDDQWRRLIPSSKIYHGALKHYLFNFILWSGQKWQKLRNL